MGAADVLFLVCFGLFSLVLVACIPLPFFFASGFGSSTRDFTCRKKILCDKWIALTAISSENCVVNYGWICFDINKEVVVISFGPLSRLVIGDRAIPLELIEINQDSTLVLNSKKFRISTHFGHIHNEWMEFYKTVEIKHRQENSISKSD